MTRAPSGLPFDDIRNLLATLPPPHEDAVAALRARRLEFPEAPESLGRLDEIAEWLARWQGLASPLVNRPLIAIFATSHGLASRGICAEPQGFTRAMVDTLGAGGAAVNQLAQFQTAGLKVFDLALDLPTPDIAEDAALTEAACAATMAFGMEAIAGGTDLLCAGALGSGGETVAAALACALFGGEPRDWVDADEFASRRIAAIEAALAFHGSALADPLEALRRVGGREIAAIAGAIIAARFQRIPVLLDGFAACVAAGVLARVEPDALAHCIAAHRSGSPAHDRLLARIGKKPLLDMGIRLGDGTGAALAIGAVKAAAAIHRGMKTHGGAEAGSGEPA